MCKAFILQKHQQEIKKHYDSLYPLFEVASGTQPEVYPGLSGFSLHLNPEKKPVLTTLQFGLSVSWSKSILANARIETAFEKKTWQKAVTTHRALVPATSFKEWQSTENNRTKQPWNISLKNSELFSFAALFFDGGQTGCFVILTTAANELMQKIHNSGPNKHRQPVFIQQNNYERWLYDDISNLSQLLHLAFMPDSHQMVANKIEPTALNKKKPARQPGLFDT